MYTGAFCPYCFIAKRLLKKAGVAEINEIRVDKNSQDFAKMQKLSGRRTVPQIFIGKNHVGGFDDLYRLHRQGGLNALLQP